jgi:hypothetical protein
MIPGICIRWYRLENFNVWGCQRFSALCVITSAIAIASEFGLHLARGPGWHPGTVLLAMRFGALLGKQSPNGSVTARNDEIGQASVFGRISGNATCDRISGWSSLHPSQLPERRRLALERGTVGLIEEVMTSQASSTKAAR